MPKRQTKTCPKPCSEGKVGYDFASKDCDICKGKGYISLKKYEIFVHNKKIDKKIRVETDKIRSKYTRKMNELTQKEAEECIKIHKKYEKQMK